VLVAGKIHGNVSSSGHLDILSTGVIEGDIDAKSLRVEIGGVFAGTSRMGIKPGDQKNPKNAVDPSPQLSAVR